MNYFTNETETSLNSNIKSQRFDLDFDISELKDFLESHDQKKYRFLAATKDILVQFLEDLKNFDTVNKGKIINFICSNHSTFLDDLIEDSSFIDKFDDVIEEAIGLFGKSSRTFGSNDAINSDAIKARIKRVCEEAAYVFIHGRGSKAKNEFSISKEAGHIIGIIKSRKSKGSSKAKVKTNSSIPSPVTFKDCILISKKLYKRNRTSILRARSLLSQLIGISTITVSVADRLFKDRKKTLKGLTMFEKKLGLYMEWIKENTFKENIINYFKTRHYIWFNILAGTSRVLSISVWKDIFYSIDSWSSSYVKNFMFEAMFPFAGLKTTVKMSIYKKILGYMEHHPRVALFSGLFTMLTSGIFSLISFIASGVFNITKKLTSIIASPLKRIVIFFLKLMTKPWVFVMFGSIVGKLFMALIESAITGKKTNIGNERKETKDMPYLKRLGSKGIFSSIQKELDFIDNVLHAVNDFFMMSGIGSYMLKYFEKLNYGETKEEEIEKMKNESKAYAFTFEALKWMDVWFIGKNGSPPKIVDIYRVAFDMISDTISRIQLKMDADKISGDTLTDKFIGNLNFLEKTSGRLQISEMFEALGNILGYGIGNVSGKMGLKTTASIVSKLPIPGYGKIISMLFGAMLPFLVGKAFGEGLTKLNVEDSPTLKAHDYALSIEKRFDYDLNSSYRPLQYVPNLKTLEKAQGIGGSITTLGRSMGRLNAAVGGTVAGGTKQIKTVTAADPLSRLFYGIDSKSDSMESTFLIDLRKILDGEKKGLTNVLIKMSQFSKNSSNFEDAIRLKLNEQGQFEMVGKKREDIIGDYAGRLLYEWLGKSKLNNGIYVDDKGRIKFVYSNLLESLNIKPSGMTYHEAQTAFAAIGSELSKIESITDNFASGLLSMSDAVNYYNSPASNIFTGKTSENLKLKWKKIFQNPEKSISEILENKKFNIVPEDSAKKNAEFLKAASMEIDKCLSDLKSNEQYDFVRSIFVNSLKSAFFSPFDDNSIGRMTNFFSNEGNRKNFRTVAEQLLGTSDWKGLVSGIKSPFNRKSFESTAGEMKDNASNILSRMIEMTTRSWEEAKKKVDEEYGNLEEANASDILVKMANGTRPVNLPDKNVGGFDEIYEKDDDALNSVDSSASLFNKKDK